MVSAAATIPVVGFVAAIPAALVVYALRSAVTGAAQDRVEIFHAPDAIFNAGKTFFNDLSPLAGLAIRQGPET